MSRKALCIILCVILTLALAACGSATSNTAEPTDAATEAPDTAAPTMTPEPTETETPTEEPAPAVEADEYYTSSVVTTFNGILEVTIGVTDGVVVSAEILAEEESLGGTMMKQYEAAIVEIGEADIDAIDALTSATTQFTQEAVRAALRDCLEQAGLMPAE